MSNELSAAAASSGEVETQSSPLYPHEIYWKDRYTWLLEKGYQLRSRYSSEWVPSWESNKKLFRGLTEDSQVTPFVRLVDATRIEDDSLVVLKLVERDDSPEEVEILKFFSQEPVASDPHNHTAPLLDVLRPPNDEFHLIIVLPVLRPYDNPDFDTVGEGLDFIYQILEGFAFLHEHRVAHRDIRSENLMMDGKGMYTQKFFPWSPEMKSDYTGPLKPRFSRTERPPKYYIIDFGFSKQFSPEDMPPSEVPKLASDLTVPEYSSHDPCDPFPIDVYTVGRLILTDFIEGNPHNTHQNGRQGFEFLGPLVTAMTQVNPSKRITMQEAVTQFNEIVSGLSVWKLRSRAIRITGRDVERGDIFSRTGASAVHWARKLSYIGRRLPPIPKASVVEPREILPSTPKPSKVEPKSNS